MKNVFRKKINSGDEDEQNKAVDYMEQFLKISELKDIKQALWKYERV